MYTYLSIVYISIYIYLKYNLTLTLKPQKLLWRHRSKLSWKGSVRTTGLRSALELNFILLYDGQEKGQGLVALPVSHLLCTFAISSFVCFFVFSFCCFLQLAPYVSQTIEKKTNMIAYMNVQMYNKNTTKILFFLKNTSDITWIEKNNVTQTKRWKK